MKVMILLNKGPAALIALEAAIRLSEEIGVASDAVVLGGPDSDILLRTAVAAGSERAVRIDPGDVGQDLLAVSGAAATTARGLGPDLILVGGREGRTGMNLLGPAMAEHLGFAHVGSAASIRIAGESVIVERRAEGVLDLERVFHAGEGIDHHSLQGEASSHEGLINHISPRVLCMPAYYPRIFLHHSVADIIWVCAYKKVIL